MQYQHLGYHIKGFYKIASFANKLEAMMATDAQQKLNALEFWDKHGLIAALDFSKVSRATLYRWKKCLEQYGTAALRDASKAPRQRRRINKDGAVQFPGHCIAMDTIHYFVNRTRYYLFTAIDHYSRFAVAITCQRAPSNNAATFAKLVHTVFPGNICQVLTDNGGEFQGDFDAYLQQHDIKHCYTYPRCPKMNAVDERFNRTIQEEFVAHHEDILVRDLTLFNEILFEYLGRYNFRRPHQGSTYKTPAQQLASFCTDLSNMLLNRTLP